MKNPPLVALGPLVPLKVGVLDLPSANIDAIAYGHGPPLPNE
jgi:hypothetical protein